MLKFLVFFTVAALSDDPSSVPGPASTFREVRFRSLNVSSELGVVALVLIAVFLSVLLVYLGLFLLPGLKEELAPLVA
jgi:hypothetical protein